MTEEAQTHDQPNWEERFPHARHRHCPGCDTELQRFNLSAMQLPIEQFTMGPLQAINKALGFSVRPFGFQNVHEMQFLSFMAVCSNCTLISNWDFGIDELDEILSSAQHPPYAQISWNYSPEAVARHLEVAPEWLKPNLQQLLDIIKQHAPANVQPKQP